jgi:hypothetical protein
MVTPRPGPVHDRDPLHEQPVVPNSGHHTNVGPALYRQKLARRGKLADVSGRGQVTGDVMTGQKAEQRDGPLCVVAVFLTAPALVPPHADR